MKVSVSIWYLLLIFFAGFIIPCIVVMFVCSTSEDRIHRHTTEIERLKKVKDSTIQTKFLEIRNLERHIIELDKSLDEYVVKIDSIEKSKRKVKVIYQIKYKEIEKYNDTTILNYWKNEFKDD